MHRNIRWMLAVVAIAAAPLAAQARSSYLSAFNSRYGTSGSPLNDCSLCHGSSGTSSFNPYGSDVRASISRGIDAALAAIEPNDSDRDGFSNLDEINADTFPGDPRSFPVAASCPDADGDGYAVCDGQCTPPANAQCGDCNDANRAVNPGVTEICTNGVDDNCDGAADARDALCAAPALTDFDIASVRATGRSAVGRKASFKVNVVQVTAGTATLAATVTENGVTTSLGTVSLSAGGTYGFTYLPTTSGSTLSWSATLTDADPDADVATATTAVR